jgi:transposase
LVTHHHSETASRRVVARAVALLDAWLSWARRCRIPAFVALAAKITRHRAGIVAALTERLSNALVESINTKLRLLMRVAFGFHSPQAMIGLAMLALGGLCPPLPGRARPDPRIWQ